VPDKENAWSFKS